MLMTIKNIYRTEDVLQNLLNPSIIGKYSDSNNELQCHYY